eukprot:3625628-Rhodomonas_salina.2
MSDTDIAHGAICLCACYSMSGTDIANGAISLRARYAYAMSGTDLASMSGTEPAYDTICLFPMSGTNLAHRCTRQVGYAG